MIALIVVAVLAAIVGLLVYRNNAAKAEKLLADTQATLDADKAKAKSILDALKGK